MDTIRELLLKHDVLFEHLGKDVIKVHFKNGILYLRFYSDSQCQAEVLDLKTQDWVPFRNTLETYFTIQQIFTALQSTIKGEIPLC